jgi:hypothetical protein
VWAPAADMGGANGGSVRGADRAGLRILSTAGQHAEFRLCSRRVSASTHSYTKTRDVELDELAQFCFVRQLRVGTPPLPDVGAAACSSGDEILAAAVGLLHATAFNLHACMGLAGSAAMIQ